MKGGRRGVLRRGAGVGLVGLGLNRGRVARAGPREKSEPKGCTCAPERAPCPTEEEASVWANALPEVLVTWSPVTGECLPWGPGGPVGLAAGTLLFANAVQNLDEPVSGEAQRRRTPQTRRPEEVERGLRRLDGLAKRNTPVLGALAILLLSVPRNPAGLGLGVIAVISGCLAGMVRWD